MFTSTAPLFYDSAPDASLHMHPCRCATLHKHVVHVSRKPAPSRRDDFDPKGTGTVHSVGEGFPRPLARISQWVSCTRTAADILQELFGGLYAS